MAGHHSAGNSSPKGTLWIVIVALVLIIAALGFMLVHFILGNSDDSQASTGLSTQIAAQDANGKNVTDKIIVSPGTKRPDSVAPEAELILLDIGWDAKRAPAMPLILTIQDKSLIDDDGLAVYHFENGQWNLLGTYLIANQSVSFQVDSLSPFAFQVISANPPVTPTPEPTPEVTPEPTPEVTPEPTPEPVDYGKHDKVQEGLFVQATGMKEDAAYVIAMIHPDEVEVPEDGEAAMFGDEAKSDKVFKATVLVNYDDEHIGSVDVMVGKTNDNKYYILDPVVEGMLWTAENAEPVSGTTRFSLVNNEKYLNLDNPNTFVVMDDDEGRTRWLYEEVDGKDNKEYNTLTYRANLGLFYVKELKAVDIEHENEEEEAHPGLEIPATGKESEALELVLFRLNDGTADVNTGSSVTGTLVLMSTPEANSGLDATPIPTINPDNNSGGTGGLPSFATPTAAPTAKPTTKPTTVPTTAPTATAVPTTVPTAVPTAEPEPTQKPEGSSGTNTPSEPVPTKKPSSGTDT